MVTWRKKRRREWKLERKCKSSTEARKLAKELNYIAHGGAGFGKPKDWYVYQARRKNVYYKILRRH